VKLGKLALRYASACLDISDGLAQDLGHLCEASRVGAHVELERLPLSRAVRDTLGPEGALAGGEDYELLLAVPPARTLSFERACARVGERVTRIGKVTAGRKWVIQTEAGRQVKPPEGFDHFRPKPG
jgi:thiamine-monophosphate kinase